MQKQTKIKMNEIDSPKLRGKLPKASKLGGVSPTAPKLPLRY